MMETTLCHIIFGNKLLLKKATRGVSKGKWNALGGKMDPGETPEESAIREVYEESGLCITNISRRGTLTFYKGSKENVFVKMHLFSATKFQGTLMEGELRWFGKEEIPYDEMWDDDFYWFPILFKGINFDGEFVFDENMERVIGYQISKIER